MSRQVKSRNNINEQHAEKCYFRCDPESVSADTRSCRRATLYQYPQCVYRFRLDNGGSGEGFGPLTLSLRLKDKQGNTLAVGEMGVEPFGDSDASRTQDASLEHECVENVSSVEIMKATEASEGYQTDLPLSVFDPQYYRPLPVSVAGGKAS